MLEAGGRRLESRAPVLVIGDDAWRAVRLGSTVALRARLAPSHDHDLAAVLTALGEPVTAARAVGVVAGCGGGAGVDP